EFGVVDPQPAQRGHAMFDRLDEKRAVLQAGAAGSFEEIINGGGDGGGFAVLLAEEEDARAGGGGGKGKRGRLAGEKPHAADGDFAGDCFLQISHKISEFAGHFRGGGPRQGSSGRNSHYIAAFSGTETPWVAVR